MKTGFELMNEGMAVVKHNSNPAWTALMYELLEETCRTRKIFSADNVFELLAAIPNAPTTHNSRAFGPVMKRAKNAGLCVKSSLPAIVSNRPSLHCSPIEQWESLVFVSNDNAPATAVAA